MCIGAVQLIYIVLLCQHSMKHRTNKEIMFYALIATMKLELCLQPARLQFTSTSVQIYTICRENFEGNVATTVEYAKNMDGAAQKLQILKRGHCTHIFNLTARDLRNYHGFKVFTLVSPIEYRTKCEPMSLFAFCIQPEIIMLVKSSWLTPAHRNGHRDKFVCLGWCLSRWCFLIMSGAVSHSPKLNFGSSCQLMSLMWWD